MKQIAENKSADIESKIMAAAPYDAPYEMIKKRPDFIKANRGMKYVTPAFILLVLYRGHHAPKRIGYTVTKKTGNAVARNRIKRRFRALCHEILPHHGMAHCDHIMIGRKEALTRDFTQMANEMRTALAYIARKSAKKTQKIYVKAADKIDESQNG
ncbi:ribonuclease P protein component [Sphingorhabdus lutea]|uniref:Ribonuclease P protein component n=1 Tax=Sphingorhabdus lutea TaxID=1913578 RepID=A0A1L3JB82_9SPHN|nr:ribonuclease P protein component [Sphingorhabdus lutea]APG62394.1 ribonuclease P protein component [Sphingorhabdus lutea]